MPKRERVKKNNPTKRSLGWCFTLNNYTEEDRQMLLAHECQYIIMGKEVAPTTGTPHLQGFVQYAKPGKSFKAMKELHNSLSLRMTKGSIQENYEYCSKEGDFEERGKKPMDQKEKGKRGRQSIEERWELAKRGRFEELPPEMIRTYEYIHRKYTTASAANDRLENYWVWGPSGCGKSSTVRKIWPNMFDKAPTKWWDGYEGEETILIDDFDPSHGKDMTFFLKRWTDHYKYPVEVKNGNMKAIRPKRFVITSQYSMTECFQGKDSDALIRRFTRFSVVPNGIQMDRYIKEIGCDYQILIPDGDQEEIQSEDPPELEAPEDVRWNS